jgi:hypothetical protein
MNTSDLNKVLAIVEGFRDTWGQTMCIDLMENKLINTFSKTRKGVIAHNHPLWLYIVKEFPNVASSKLEPPSFDQCEKLKRKYHHELIIEKLKGMENKGKLDYKTIYYTLDNWCDMAVKNGWKPPVQKPKPVVEKDDFLSRL